MRRNRTARGADLDLALLDCTVSVLENAISRCTVTGDIPRPLGTRHPSITPFQAFRAADGLLVLAAGNDVLWRKLCMVLAVPALADDPLLATNDLRTVNHVSLEAALENALAKRTVVEWLDSLSAAGIPAAPIHDIAQVLDDPQLAARDMWHTLIDSDGQTLITPSSPIVLDGNKPRLAPTWPRLGEHQDSVLRSWLGEDAEGRI